MSRDCSSSQSIVESLASGEGSALVGGGGGGEPSSPPPMEGLIFCDASIVLPTGTCAA
jgi:hypothetical protein